MFYSNVSGLEEEESSTNGFSFLFPMDPWVASLLRRSQMVRVFLQLVHIEMYTTFPTSMKGSLGLPSPMRHTQIDQRTEDAASLAMCPSFWRQDWWRG